MTSKGKKAKKVPTKSAEITGDAGVLRLCQRAGVTRVSGEVYEVIRGNARFYLENLVRDSAFICKHAGRKIIVGKDVQTALSLHGKEIAA